MNLPSTPDAKFQHPMKRPKVNIHTAFCHVHPFKSPTRLPEDPQKVSDHSLILLFWTYPGAREVSD
jgi:hypothetical protein